MMGLKQQVAKGAAWLVLLKFLERGIGFISTLFLARLLVPADFGLVAMATSILAALELLGAFGFDLALIQNQNTERRHYDTVWTFGVLFGAFIALGMCCIASTAATFFNEPRVENLMYVLALGSLMGGLGNVGVVAFQKDFELHKEFMYSLAKKLVGFVITIYLAFILRNYWALVAGIIATRMTSLYLSYSMHSYRPRFCLSAAAELFHFSKWMLLNNFLIFLNNRGTDFIMGKVGGPQALGLYSVSYEIANLPTSELVFPISRAVFPGYARLAGDTDQLSRAFLQVIGLVALLTIPAGAGIALVAEPLVQLLLGPKWLDTIPLIQVLAVFGIVRSIHGPNGSIYLALGKPSIVAMLQAVQLVIALGLMLVLVPDRGPIGAAWAILIAACITMTANYIMVVRELRMQWLDLVTVFWRPFVATGGMAVTLIAFANHLWPTEPSVGVTALRLVAMIMVGVLSYAAMIGFCWYCANKPNGTESELAKLVGLRGWRRAQPGN